MSRLWAVYASRRIRISSGNRAADLRAFLKENKNCIRSFCLQLIAKAERNSKRYKVNLKGREVFVRTLDAVLRKTRPTCLWQFMWQHAGT